MVIHQDALDRHFYTFAAERRLAEKLDEAFDVTHGKRFQGLSFWVAQPKPNIKERFGFDLELPVVYSEFSTTDMRCLTVLARAVTDTEFKYRTDRTVAILIHNGDQQQTRDLVRERAKDKVIICIHTSELSNPARGARFLQNRLAEELGLIDLFGLSAAITEERYFFGRQDLVQSITAQGAAVNQCYGVFGLRKTGKTSVLFAAQRRFTNFPILAPYIALDSPGAHTRRWWGLLEHIAGACKTEYFERFGRRIRLKQEKYTAITAPSLFKEAMVEILKLGRLRQIVLMMDEIEWITPGVAGAFAAHWDQDHLPFWQTIRSIHQETRGHLVFVVAGVNPRAVEQASFSDGEEGAYNNPVFQLAAPLYLKPFSRDQIRAMVRKIGRYCGMHFDEEVYGYLQNQYGGHPFLVRRACSAVWEARRSEVADDGSQRVTKQAFVKQGPAIQARLADPIRDILLSLLWWYTGDYETLEELSSEDNAFIKAYIHDEPELEERLNRWGLTREEVFAIPDMQDFLRKYGRQYREFVSPYRRNGIAPEIVLEVPEDEKLKALVWAYTRLESSIRAVVLNYLAIAASPKNDTAAIHTAIVSAVQPRQHRPDPENHFAGQSPKSVMKALSLSELIDVILGNWPHFSALFGPERRVFERNARIANEGRNKIIHGKSVSSEKLAEYDRIAQWFARRIDPVVERLKQAASFAT